MARSTTRRIRRKGALTVITALVIIILVSVILFGGLIFYSWRSSWEPYMGELEIDPREGNATMPRTLFGTEWFLNAYVWKTAVLFEANESGIKAGVAGNGKARIYKQFIPGNRFAMKLPREHRIYFAINSDGRRVKLREVERHISVDDPRFKDIPLF